jgi:hypothetical protein
MSDPFYRPPIRRANFHGRISKVRADKGYANYLNLTAGHYRIRVFLNGKEHVAITADPYTGIIKVDGGTRCVTLSGHVEIRLERLRKPLG